MPFYVKQQFCPENDSRLALPIEALELPVREQTVLENHGIKTVGDVLRHGSLERVRGLGRKGIDRLIKALSKLFERDLVHS